MERLSFVFRALTGLVQHCQDVYFLTLIKSATSSPAVKLAVSRRDGCVLRPQEVEELEAQRGV